MTRTGEWRSLRVLPAATKPCQHDASQDYFVWATRCIANAVRVTGAAAGEFGSPICASWCRRFRINVPVDSAWKLADSSTFETKVDKVLQGKQTEDIVLRVRPSPNGHDCLMGLLMPTIINRKISSPPKIKLNTKDSLNAVHCHCDNKLKIGFCESHVCFLSFLVRSIGFSAIFAKVQFHDIQRFSVMQFYHLPWAVSQFNQQLRQIFASSRRCNLVISSINITVDHIYFCQLSNGTVFWFKFSVASSLQLCCIKPRHFFVAKN